MSGRRGSVTGETLLALVGWGGVLVLVIDLVSMSLGRLRVEAAREAAVGAVIQAVDPPPAGLWPEDPTVDRDEGGCEAWTTPVGVGRWDAAVRSTRVRVTGSARLARFADAAGSQAFTVESCVASGDLAHPEPALEAWKAALAGAEGDLEGVF